VEAGRISNRVEINRGEAKSRSALLEGVDYCISTLLKQSRKATRKTFRAEASAVLSQTKPTLPKTLVPVCSKRMVAPEAVEICVGEILASATLRRLERGVPSGFG
jgi:hypothetical protein